MVALLLNWAVMVGLAGGFVALVNIGLKTATVKGFGVLPVSVYFISVGLGMIVYAVAVGGRAVIGQNLASPEGFKYAFLAALAGIVSNVLLFTAMTTAPAGLGFTIFNVMSTLGTVVLGILLLKEAITPLQAAGVGMAVLGVVLMTWKV